MIGPIIQVLFNGGADVEEVIEMVEFEFGELVVSDVMVWVGVKIEVGFEVGFEVEDLDVVEVCIGEDALMTDFDAIFEVLI